MSNMEKDIIVTCVFYCRYCSSSSLIKIYEERKMKSKGEKVRIIIIIIIIIWVQIWNLKSVWIEGK
jgi:uncharacterized membrane protein YbaN (DUF454 family)